jgi:multidrug efflux pump
MLARFFVDRPVLATVLSIVIVIIGSVALTQLPVAQYPEVTPPTVQVAALYPGANAETVAKTVATPIEQEVNGVEGMIYMASRCTNDGQMLLDVTFKLGTDLDKAQVLVQNRVAVAQAKLPEEVKRTGVTTKKKSPSILLCVNLLSKKRADGGFYYDQLYLSNYASLNVKDDLARIDGVGDVAFLGPRDYSMRVWLDPTKLAALQLTANDVVAAIREQNVQVAAGRLGQPPVPDNVNVPFQLVINTRGRLTTEDEFGEIVIRRGEQGQLVHLREVVRATRYDANGEPIDKGIELGAKNYDVNSYLNGDPSVTLALFQLPGSNALSVARTARERMRQLRADFPKGLDYEIVYDTTVFIDESVHEVYKTLFEAFILVFIVVLIFLQDWRATLLPMIDVPVSLIGTFAVMALLGFSLNNLTLFGLVLAIGIVVDDAIVVVENIERWMATGLPPREATIKAMDEITGPVIAITLVLSAVFIPTAFLAGITGEFYRQFALTIAASTIISAINAMTMAPARAVTLIKPHVNHATSGPHGAAVREVLPPWGIGLLFGFAAYKFAGSLVLQWLGLATGSSTMRGGEAGGTGGAEELGGVSGADVLGGTFASTLSDDWLRMVLGWLVAAAIVGGVAAGARFLAPWVNRLLSRFLDGFNRVFEWLADGYGVAVRRMVRLSLVLAIVYGGLLAATVFGFRVVPAGFIPEQDKGYLLVNVQLPDGASLSRTDGLVRELSEIARSTPGVAHTIAVPGYSLLLGANISNVGGMFVILEPFEDRKLDRALHARRIAAELGKRFAARQEASIGVFGAPPVDGLGSTGGVKIQVQDRRGAGLRALRESVGVLSDELTRNPRIAAAFSTFSVSQPQLYVDIDREKAKSQGVSVADINSTLQAYLGSVYVNDFLFQDRNWQVNVQADPRFRIRVEDIGRLEVRNAAGSRVPLSALIRVRDMAGPAVVNHFNLYPSAEITGVSAPGVSSRQAITVFDESARNLLPNTLGTAWTELAFQELEAEKDLLAKIVFPLAVLFVFLVLASQYESWTLPLAILLIVPMCLLSALAGLAAMRLDNNIFAQIGFVVLIGLAAKNAILVVEFAKQQEDAGKSRLEAIVEASRTRLRPILMTSFAFILGVLPLALAKGAGAEMRVPLGVAVSAGMLGVTFFGLVFTPVFYWLVMKLAGRPRAVPGTTLDDEHSSKP